MYPAPLLDARTHGLPLHPLSTSIVPSRKLSPTFYQLPVLGLGEKLDTGDG